MFDLLVYKNIVKGTHPRLNIIPINAIFSCRLADKWLVTKIIVINNII